jgi:hypothetical protein
LQHIFNPLLLSLFAVLAPFFIAWFRSNLHAFLSAPQIYAEDFAGIILCVKIAFNFHTNNHTFPTRRKIGLRISQALV